MVSNHTNTGAKAIFKSLRMVGDGEDWRLIDLVVTYTGWFLLLFVLVIYLLSPELRTRDRWMYGWVLAYVIYHVVLEVLRRTRKKLYETPGFRMVRIQVVLVLVSVLLILTGGSQSYFWFIYLLPLFASALYFPWAATWIVYAEAAILYVLSAVVASGALAATNLVLSLTNLSILLLLTIVLRYLVETIRKLQATERALVYSERLQQIQQDMDTAINLDDVLDRIIRRAVESVGARDGSMMLLQEDGTLHFRARVGGLFPLDKEVRTFVLGAPDEGIAGWVARNRKPYVCQDTETDPRFVDIVAGSPIRSLASVPIIAHGIVLGVINVDSPEPNRFSAADAEALAALANQVAVAIERAELLEGWQRFSQRILGGAEDFYQHIVDAVHRLTRSPVSIWQLDETMKQARIVASRGVGPRYVQNAVVDLERGVIGQAIRERKIVPVRDIQAHPDFQRKEDAAREGLVSMLAVPLLAGPEKAVGSLSIYSRTRRDQFTQWEKDLLRTFAGQGAIAIKSAQLFRELQHRAQQFVKLQELTAAISKMQQRDEILRLAVGGLCEIFPGTSCFIREYDSRSEEFKALASAGELKNLVHREPRPDGTSRYLVQSKTPRYLVGDQLLMPPDQGPALRPEILEKGVQAAAYLPLVTEKDARGVLYVNFTTPHQFTQEDKRLLELFANHAAIAIENAQLFQERVQREKQLIQLQRVTAAITGTDEREEVLELIIQSLGDIFPGVSCAVRLYNSTLDEFEPLKGTGVLEGIKDSPPRDTGSSRLVLRTKTPRYLEGDELANPTDGGPAFREDLLRRGVKAAAYQPLISMGGGIGILYVDWTAPHHFSPEDKQLLALFADQAAIAIENARKVQQLKALNQIGRTLINLDIEEILEVIREQTRKLMDVRNIQIAFHDEDTGTVTFPVGYVNDEKAEAGIGIFAPRQRAQPLKPGEQRKPGEPRYGLTEYVIDQGKAERSQGDIGEWAKERRIELSPDVPTKSWVGAPLKVWDPESQTEKVIGLISIQSLQEEKDPQEEDAQEEDAQEEDAYDDSDVQLLETVANQIAIAVQNARLYRDLDAMVHHLDELVEERTQQLQTAYDQLRRAQEREIWAALGEVTAGLIHKMSNTIGPIPFLTDRIRKTVGPTDEATEKKLYRISEGAADALAYTAGLAKILELGEIRKEAADVRALVDDATRQAVPDPKAQHIVVDTSYDSDLPTLYVNSPLVIEALHNIIHNAADAMPSGGRIDIRVEKVGDEGVGFQIADTGCGIPKDNWPKVFRPGFSSKKEGKGIGLWFAKTVVDQHQGTISFESKEGEGTTFTIFLPVGEPSPTEGVVGEEVGHV